MNENTSKIFKRIIWTIIILLLLYGLSKSGEDSGKLHYYDFEVGNEYKIKEISYGATSEENYKLMMMLLGAEDLNQFEKMKWSTKVIPLEKGTTIRVIENDSDKTKVLITNGFYNGNIVYIMWSALQK